MIGCLNCSALAVPALSFGGDGCSAALAIKHCFDCKAQFSFYLLLFNMQPNKIKLVSGKARSDTGKQLRLTLN